jgi:hypothetical protein
LIVLVAFTTGMVFWILAWAFGFGIKSFDAFCLVLILTAAAAAIRVVSPSVNRLRGREVPAPDQRA